MSHQGAGVPETRAQFDADRAEREAGRIVEEYARRDRARSSGLRSAERPAVREFFEGGKRRAIERLLADTGRLPLSGRRILDVGCGSGAWLARYVAWGAAPGNLAGIDLREQAVEAAHRRLEQLGGTGEASPDLRTGDAACLPWPDASFSLVSQFTVFTSILDDEARRWVAGEMWRVLAPGGAVLWYDFRYDNPANPNVRRVGRDEIESLFPGASIRLRRVTLAPPLARALASWAAPVARGLERLVVLNTHLLGLLEKAASAGSEGQ